MRRSLSATRLAGDRALLSLALAGGASRPRRRLLHRFGNPRAALDAGPGEWAEAGCDTAQIQRLRTPDYAAIDTILAWRDGGNRHLLGWDDPDYPPLLAQIAQPPLLLYLEGEPTLLWQPAIAVVGSRAPTAGGRANAQIFARAICDAGLGVVSGLASGIDAIAHQAALDQRGMTVAVLGTGPDLAYPDHHQALRQRIAEHGLLLSEYPPGCGPRPGHFPARNRLIAGLALGTLVIEAAQRSGALITARLASEAGREVFAVPGSIRNPMAQGCHRLIRDGASLVDRPEQVVDGVGALATELARALRARLAAAAVTTGDAANADRAHTPAPTPDPPLPERGQQIVWDALGYDPVSMDWLVQRTGLTAATLSSMLLLMELEGRVVVEHGRYARNS